MSDADLPLIALVGRPNVGKSSLYNRLVGGRPALVEDIPGVTRDRRYGVADWGPTHFRVVDTGGLNPSAAGILGAMRQQTLRALDEADLVVFVVDAREGITAVDDDVAQGAAPVGTPGAGGGQQGRLRQDRGGRQRGLRARLPRRLPPLGLHGRGVNNLLDAAVARMPARARVPGGRVTDGVERPKKGAMLARSKAKAGKTDEPGEGDEKDEKGDEQDDVPAGPLRLAFIGKPNVGKSSLVNCLLGEERVLVHDEPGTTRNPIDTPFSFAGREYVLVDTAGMRRRRSIDTLDRTRRRQDGARSAGALRRRRAGHRRAPGRHRRGRPSGRPDRGLGSLRAGRPQQEGSSSAARPSTPRWSLDARELSFLRYAPAAADLGGHTRRRHGILEAAPRSAFEQASRRISTGELNKLLEQIVAHKPPPAGRGGRHVSLYYITQAAVRPPTFFLSTNHPAEVGYPYRRFLINRLREAYGFEGTPIRLALRAHTPEEPPAGRGGGR